MTVKTSCPKCGHVWRSRNGTPQNCPKCGEEKHSSAKAKHVVVTTEHRGVFGGTLLMRDDAAKTVALGDAQMCVYWSSDVRGVLGLASSGPSASCKVSPIVPRIDLQGVTAIIESTPAAQKCWRARPWQ